MGTHYCTQATYNALTCQHAQTQPHLSSTMFRSGVCAPKAFRSVLMRKRRRCSVMNVHTQTGAHLRKKRTTAISTHASRMRSKSTRDTPTAKDGTAREKTNSDQEADWILRSATLDRSTVMKHSQHSEIITWAVKRCRYSCVYLRPDIRYQCRDSATCVSLTMR